MGSLLECISAKVPEMKVQSGPPAEFEMHAAADNGIWCDDIPKSCTYEMCYRQTYLGRILVTWLIRQFCFPFSHTFEVTFMLLRLIFYLTLHQDCF